MYRLKVTYELKLPDDIAESPAELIEMFNNKEFILNEEDIAEVSAVQMDGFKYMPRGIGTDKQKDWRQCPRELKVVCTRCCRKCNSYNKEIHRCMYRTDMEVL